MGEDRESGGGRGDREQRDSGRLEKASGED